MKKILMFGLMSNFCVHASQMEYVPENSYYQPYKSNQSPDKVKRILEVKRHVLDLWRKVSVNAYDNDPRFIEHVNTFLNAEKEMLIEHLDAEDLGSNTDNSLKAAIFLALRYSSIDIFKFFYNVEKEDRRSSNPDFELVPENNYEFMLQAASCGKKEILDFLLKPEADNSSSLVRNIPKYVINGLLINAAKNKNLDIIDFVLQRYINNYVSQDELDYRLKKMFKLFNSQETIDSLFSKIYDNSVMSSQQKEIILNIIWPHVSANTREQYEAKYELEIGENLQNLSLQSIKIDVIPSFLKVNNMEYAPLVGLYSFVSQFVRSQNSVSFVSGNERWEIESGGDQLRNAIKTMLKISDISSKKAIDDILKYIDVDSKASPYSVEVGEKFVSVTYKIAICKPQHKKNDVEVITVKLKRSTALFM